MTAKLPEQVIKLWNNWEIRVMVLLSLKLQIILIIFGSRRKYIARTWIWILVWFAYLSADMVATVALGSLARSQGDPMNCPSNLIQAFWAPFLLLHLGGPDTITAYSIQDNELWLRHLLGLLVQVGVATYVFVRSWNGTDLTFLAIPMFIAGIIKYGERTCTLKSSTTTDIKGILRSVNPRLREQGGQSTKEIMVVPRPSNRPMGNFLHQAYYLFRMSIFLFEDLILGLSELKDSYSIISEKSSEGAFKLIEVELGLIYDLFYTKAVVIYSNLGIFLRSVSFLSSVTALVIFSIIIDKQLYPKIDIDITYLLLVGALILEVYGFFHLIFSDWTVILYFKDENQPTNSISRAICSVHSYLTNGKRWSGSIAQFNLISSCLKINPPKCLESFGIDEMMKHMYIKWKDIDADMKKMIFMHLSRKGKDIVDHLHDTNLRNKLVAQRGDGVLERMQQLDNFWSTVELEFNHSLLIWHIATDLCYYGDLHTSANNLSPHCKIDKCLSDYMLFLLALRTSMLPKGIGDIDSRYRDACKEVRQFFENRGRISKSENDACIELLHMDPKTLENHIVTPAAPPRVFGTKGGSKYTLVDGCKLAEQLQSLTFVDKWEMISEVWIEMLAYAATHCEWKEHSQQLRKGGELLTHVCLLMAHLGLSQHYQEASIDEQV